MRRIAIVMDPIARFDVERDTTFVIIEEALRRGIETYCCEQEALGVRDARPWGRFRQINALRRVQGRHADLGPETDRCLDDFEVIWMRKDPPVTMAYIYATQILDLVAERTWVINRPEALRAANEKLYAFCFPQLMPKTLLSNSARELKAFYHELGDEMIIKPIHGAGGRDIFRITPGDSNLNALIETMTDEGRRWIMAQAFIPEVVLGDKRIIMIDGEAVGATARLPPADDHRANIHVGGACVSSPLSARDREICEALGPRLRDDGLFFVGIDVIGDWLTEINVTSPTGVQEINRLDGVCLERGLWDTIAMRYARR